MDKVEAIKILKDFHDKSSLFSVITALETLHPELAETEDERIKKCIIDTLKGYHHLISTGGITKEDMITWIKKQGEQKHIIDGILTATNYDKMFQNCNVHKFNVGDWVISTLPGIKYPHLITDVLDGYYIFGEDDDHTHIAANDNILKLWTIQDAKDGDVLAEDPIEGHPSSFVAIYKKQNEEDFDTFDSYCFVGFDGKFYEGEYGHSSEDIHPATKEQRDLLFQKMHEVGYEWDEENKELKKIEQKPAWSEDGKKHIIDIIDYLDDYYSFAKDEYEDVADGVLNEIRWLQSI